MKSKCNSIKIEYFSYFSVFCGNIYQIKNGNLIKNKLVCLFVFFVIKEIEIIFVFIEEWK